VRGVMIGGHSFVAYACYVPKLVGLVIANSGLLSFQAVLSF